MTIQSVFWWDMDRRSAGVLLHDGNKHWCDSLPFEELWNHCASPSETRWQFEQDIIGQALVLIEGGEARPTSASL